MCDQCHPPLSRRDLLKGAAAGLAAAALAACQPQEPLTELPDAFQDHIVDEFGPAVKIDRSKLTTPPPTPPQRSDYGSIMPRAAWTAVPLEVRNGVAMDGVNKITIHHSGDGKPFFGETTADVARHLQIVQQAHLQRGMVDIAYHFAVDRTGRVWQLRWLGYEGQHVRNSANGTRNNPHNVGIVLIGDFNLQQATVAQRDRTLELIRTVRAKYGLDQAAVFMHGELVDTDCPGKALKPLIVDARKSRLV